MMENVPLHGPLVSDYLGAVQTKVSSSSLPSRESGGEPKAHALWDVSSLFFRGEWVMIPVTSNQQILKVLVRWEVAYYEPTWQLYTACIPGI